MILLIASACAWAGSPSQSCYLTSSAGEVRIQVYPDTPEVPLRLEDAPGGVVAVRVESWDIDLAMVELYQMVVSDQVGRVRRVSPDPHLPREWNRAAGVGWVGTFGVRLVDPAGPRAYPLTVTVGFAAGGPKCTWTVDAWGHSELVRSTAEAQEQGQKHQ